MDEQKYINRCHDNGCEWMPSKYINLKAKWHYYQCCICGNEMYEITRFCTTCSGTGDAYGICEYDAKIPYSDSLHIAIGDMINTYKHGLSKEEPVPCRDYNEWRLLLDMQELGKSLEAIDAKKKPYGVWDPITPIGIKLQRAIMLMTWAEARCDFLDGQLHIDIQEYLQCVSKQQVSVGVTQSII